MWSHVSYKGGLHVFLVIERMLLPVVKHTDQIGSLQDNGFCMKETHFAGKFLSMK